MHHPEAIGGVRVQDDGDDAEHGLRQEMDPPAAPTATRSTLCSRRST